MLKALRTAEPVCPHDIVRCKNVAGSAWLERNTPVPVPGSCHSSLRDEQLGNSRATHRARLPTSRGIETFPTGYTELTRRPRIPGAQEKEGRRSTAIRGRGRRLYVKWIRQRYASSRWIAFPALLIPRPSRDRARRGLLVFSEQDPSVDPGKLYRLKPRWR